MAYEPSTRYEIDIDNRSAKVYNTIFPDMTISLTPDEIIDLVSTHLGKTAPEELVASALRSRYRDKYGA